MAKQADRMVNLSELLDILPRFEVEKGQLAAVLQEIPLESKLLTLAEVSIERETEYVREILTAAGKL